MASVALTWGLTEPFEVEAACVLCNADVYLLLTLFKVLVFDSGLTLIPLCNRLKERYACGPTGHSKTGPVLLTGQNSQWVARRRNPAGRSTFPSDAAERTRGCDQRYCFCDKL
jgi:hypothetical protein